jgi:hypothetical protein
MKGGRDRGKAKHSEANQIPITKSQAPNKSQISGVQIAKSGEGEARLG